VSDAAALVPFPFRGFCVFRGSSRFLNRLAIDTVFGDIGKR
jgi:hypothetical protein